MYINHKFLVLLVISTAIIGIPLQPLAEQPLGQFGVWEAFTENSGKNRICYIATEAIKARGNYKKRGKTYIMVTHRPAQNIINVVSVEAGYTYKKGSEVTIIIGRKTFTLFTSKTTAFTYDAETDHALVKAMKKGAVMTVKGLSLRGTTTTDTYSLKGFSASYNSTSVACKL